MRRLLGILAIAFASTASAQVDGPVVAAINSVKNEAHGKTALVANPVAKEATTKAAETLGLPMPADLKEYNSSINVWKVTENGNTATVRLGTFVTDMLGKAHYRGYSITLVKRGNVWVVESKRLTSVS